MLRVLTDTPAPGRPAARARLKVLHFHVLET